MVTVCTTASTPLVAMLHLMQDTELVAFVVEDRFTEDTYLETLNIVLCEMFIAGHHKIRAFVTHGGLLSMFETVYHAVPVVTMPVFCDHDANSAKAVIDGYALKLELQELTADKLVWAINQVIHDSR